MRNVFRRKVLERHSSNQHWRKNPVILSGSATSAGISHASLTLKTVGMADLLDGVKSDANRTFDYLNGALAVLIAVVMVPAMFVMWVWPVTGKGVHICTRDHYDTARRLCRLDATVLTARAARTAQVVITMPTITLTVLSDHIDVAVESEDVVNDFKPEGYQAPHTLIPVRQSWDRTTATIPLAWLCAHAHYNCTRGSVVINARQAGTENVITDGATVEINP